MRYKGAVSDTVIQASAYPCDLILPVSEDSKKEMG